MCISESIVNCFSKAGYVSPVPKVEQECLDCLDGMMSNELKSYVTIDRSLECVGKLSDQDIGGPLLDTD